MTVIVTTQVVDNRQDPLPDKVEGKFGRIAPESDQVDYLTANAYGTTEPEFSAHDIMWG